MDYDRLNRWLTLGANVGVVIGLALLIVELNQANKIAKAEARSLRFEEQQQAQMTFADSSLLPAIRDKALSEGVASLSSVERSRLQRWEWSVALRMQNHFFLAKEWGLGEAVIDDILTSAAGSYPLWTDLGVPVRDREFADAVEAQFSESLDPKP